MKLSAEETKLFFELMLPLQFFVNSKLGVLGEIETLQDYKNISFAEKFRVRNALFENIHLIDEFIDENPQDVSLKNLAAAAGWKRFVSGDFYVERHLKTSTIFIGENNEVYGVRGLTDSLDKIFPKYLLPQIVSAILIPFQNKIVADGFYSASQIYVGGNIRAELRAVYARAKKRNAIIETL